MLNISPFISEKFENIILLAKTQIADGGLSTHPIYTFYVYSSKLQISISFREKCLYKQFNIFSFLI